LNPPLTLGVIVEATMRASIGFQTFQASNAASTGAVTFVGSESFGMRSTSTSQLNALPGETVIDGNPDTVAPPI
jgi:hypothetical protein